MKPVLLFAVAVYSPAAIACSFCGGSIASQSTLRERFGQAKAVVHGTLKSPTFTDDRGAGTTEFHFVATIKAHEQLARRSSLLLPRYIPLNGKPALPYLLFFDALDGKPDAFFGLPASDGISKYLDGIARLPASDTGKRLAYFFAHLDSPDPVLAEDAFLEFAKTPDADIRSAKAQLQPDKLQRLLLAPETPSHRIGVYAIMLGLCGDKSHADTFAKLLTLPLHEGLAGNLGGLLAGYAIVDAQAGWTAIQKLILDTKQPYPYRISAIQAVQFFQAAHPTVYRRTIIELYKAGLPDAEVADLLIEDLRRWGWWDLTADILALVRKPTHTAKIFKRGIVRYALSCPESAAKDYINATRKSEPQLVADVEDALKLNEPQRK